MIPSELFDALRSHGYDVPPGELGENVATTGLDLERMPLRTRIRLGPAATVELTGLRTPCVLIDRFRSGLKRHILSSEKTGVIRHGVSTPDRRHKPLIQLTLNGLDFSAHLHWIGAKTI